MSVHRPRNPSLGDAARLAAIETWARQEYRDGEVPDVLANALWHRVPPSQESACDEWPECALDRDRCAATAVMGRGNCPERPASRGRAGNLTDA